MSVIQASKDRRNNDLIPDEIVKPIRVTKQVIILAMSETAVLFAYDKGGIISVNKHPNLPRRRWTLVARGVAKVMPPKLFHVLVSKLAEKDTNLAKVVVVAEEGHTMAGVTIVNKKWIHDITVNTVPLYKSMRTNPNKSPNIYR